MPKSERNYGQEKFERLGRTFDEENSPAQWVTAENHFLREDLAPFDENDSPIVKYGEFTLEKKSEALAWTQLGQLYLGRDEWLTPEDDEEEDEETPTPRKVGRPKGSKTKRSNFPRPIDTKILGKFLNFSEWLTLRDKARKDLLFLAIDILRGDFIERVHRPVANVFVQKNFDGVYYKGYTLKAVHDAIDRQDRVDELNRATKEALILDPRGFFKSTLNMVDCIQWMLNVPDIRILIMTAKRRLANDFVKYIKGKLYLSETADPTDFHLLFPEYVLRKASGRSNTPILLRCRKIAQVEPTVSATSIESGWAGVHCDIKKNDDVVDEKNSNNDETRTSLKEQIDNSDNLRGAWGFTDNIGTRYRINDWYGDRLNIRDEKNQPIKYFRRACWTVKPGFEHVPLQQLEEHMVDLLFPELSKNPWVDLKKKLDINPLLFRCQQLNEPALSDEDFKFRVTFNEDVLRRHTYPLIQVPEQGDIFVAWDWALTTNKRSDYSAGVVAKRWVKDDKWNLTILEVKYGQWTLSQLAEEIARLDKRWNPQQTMIEQIPGIDLFKKELMMWCMRLDHQPRLYWKEPSNEPDAKRNRIKQLEILLNDDRLWFAYGHGNWMDETFSQLTRYTGERKNRGRHDDIPDAMSMLYYYLPGYIPTKEELNSKEKMWAMQRQYAAQIDFHKRIFGGWGDTSPVGPPVQLEPAQSNQIDPRNRIFGNNGMHI